MWVEKRVSKAGDSYFKTMALLDNGEEASGFGGGFRVGDKVEVFLHEKYDEIKMRKGGHETEREEESQG